MDRRVVLAGLAAFAAAPALAQQSGAAPVMPAGQAGATGAGRLGQAEAQHMQQTLQLGAVALDTSRLAQQKARNEDVKQFAGFEVEEQTTIAEILRGMMDPAATAAVAPAPGTTAGAAPAQGAAAGAVPQMDSRGREMVQKLSQVEGEAFDREYLQGQIQGHRDLLEVQDRYLRSNPQNRDHMNMVKLARGRIMEHIALLEDMRKTVR